MKNIYEKIKELEEFLGFPLSRKGVRLEDNLPHDESVSYGLCQRLYGNPEDIKKAINRLTCIIIGLKKIKGNNNLEEQIAFFFSVLGDLYYLEKDFDKAINCFMKALSYNREDITNWAGLIFSLRSHGEFKIFEEMIFRFEEIYIKWREDKSNEMDQKKLKELLWNNKI